MSQLRYRPLQLLWILPVIVLQFQFDDAFIGMLFAVPLAFVTAKLFPWTEKLPEKSDT